MVLSYTFDSDRAMTLEEYIEYLDRNVDVHDQDSLAESASYLHRLSLDSTLLHPLIRASLVGADTIGVQEGNSYSDATFILARPKSGRFFIRANIWKVPKERAGSTDHDTQVYSYDLAHDHNFDFLTVGYCGPGYTTRTYEYDSRDILGVVGEKVGLRFVEETTLPRGKVMYYRKSRDVHTQKPPEALSVSVNLMVNATDQSRRQQYYFDTDAGSILGYTGGLISDRVSLIEFAELLGEEAIEPLLALANRHLCHRTRAAAIRAVLALAPGERDGLLSSLGGDKSVHVQRELAPEAFPSP